MEHLREYQDYVLAYRLRALVGGKSKPLTGYLSLAEYANKRMQRQRLAEMLLKKANYHADMRQVDKLTEEMNFGFWHNPGESVTFLRHVIEQGGCAALESESNFITYLLTPLERSKLRFNEEGIVARYYLGLACGRLRRTWTRKCSPACVVKLNPCANRCRCLSFTATKTSCARPDLSQGLATNIEPRCGSVAKFLR